MKNIHIYRFLENHLAEDLFLEVCSILSNTNISTKNKSELLAEKYWPRLDYIKANILINKYKEGKKMSEKQQNENSNNRKRRDPKAEKEALISKAKITLKNLNALVDEYELESRTSYVKDRQIKNIVNSANTILFNETKNVFSIATDLLTVRELIFNIQHVDGILESFNRGIERLTKKGAYDEIPKQLEMATKFTASLNTQIKDLNSLISKKLEEGFGSRRDLARFAIDKENAAKEKLRELKREVAEAYGAGELFSKLESKLKDEISDEAISEFKKQNVNAFLKSNKEKIFKVIASKKDYTVVAEQFETDMKTLYAFLNNVEKEAKIEELLEEIKNKIHETIVNDLVKNKITVRELYEKYPKGLVKKATSMIKNRNQKEPETGKKVSEKKA